MSSQSSLSPEGRATQSQPKTKQERIRDNQRRSRARRQEYLAELERRLSECQLTCREAVLQREAMLELQIENTKMRELCSIAGYNDQFVEQWVSQGVAQVTQYPQEPNSALRQLKPKIAPVDTSRTLSSNGLPPNMMQQPSSRRPSTILSASSMGNPDRTLASTPSSMYGPLTPVSSFPISPMPQPNATGFDWVYPSGQVVQPQQIQDQEHQQSYHVPPQSQSLADSFGCESFDLSIAPNTRVTNSNTISSSLAKQMIDQYQVPSVDAEQIESMLAQGISQPAYPGAGYTVDNNTVFQVLNKLGAYPYGHNEQ